MAVSNCACVLDAAGRELVRHGSPSFPIACYEEDTNRVFVPWHWHEEFEAIAVMSGSCTVCLEGLRLPLAAGQGIFISSQALHAVEKGEKDPCNIRSLVFHPRLIGGSSESVFWQNLVTPLLMPGSEHILLSGAEPWQKTALDFFTTAWDAVARQKPGYENEVRYRLTAALDTLCDHRPPPPRHRQHYAAAQRMKDMLLFLEEHYPEELTVERIGAAVGLGESACLRLFRQFLDTSPIQYVKQLRLERAAGLLVSTRQPISEIAIRCGFSDLSYFTRSFRQTRGMTPKAYRALYRHPDQTER